MLREALGEACGEALGAACGEAFGDALGEALRDALGDALGPPKESPPKDEAPPKAGAPPKGWLPPKLRKISACRSEKFSQKGGKCLIIILTGFQKKEENIHLSLCL